MPSPRTQLHEKLVGFIHQSLRIPGLSLLLFAGFLACASSPQPQQEAAVQEQKEPLSISGLSVEKESLQGMTLALSGSQNLGGTAHQASWTARVGDELLGSGEATVRADEEGNFQLELPIQYGEGFLIVDPEAGPQTAEVVVNISIAHEAGEVSASRSVRLRRPALPRVNIQMQASRSGPNTVALVYYFAVRNPNSFDVRASILRYEALIADKVVSDGELPLATRIPGWADASFDLPAEANTQNVGRGISALIQQESLDWSFRGSVKISGMEIPIDLTGGIQLSR